MDFSSVLSTKQIIVLIAAFYQQVKLYVLSIGMVQVRNSCLCAMVSLDQLHLHNFSIATIAIRYACQPRVHLLVHIHSVSIVYDFDKTTRTKQKGTPLLVVYFEKSIIIPSRTARR